MGSTELHRGGRLTTRWLPGSWDTLTASPTANPVPEVDRGRPGRGLVGRSGLRRGVSPWITSLRAAARKPCRERQDDDRRSGQQRMSAVSHHRAQRAPRLLRLARGADLPRHLSSIGAGLQLLWLLGLLRTQHRRRPTPLRLAAAAADLAGGGHLHAPVGRGAKDGHPRGAADAARRRPATWSLGKFLAGLGADCHRARHDLPDPPDGGLSCWAISTGAR